MQFLSIHLWKGKYLDFLELIRNPQKKILIFTPNPEIFVRASRDEIFLDFLQRATYLTPDGNGLYVGAMMQEGIGFFRAGLRVFFQKKEVAERYGELIKGSDLTRDLFEYSAKEGKHILILDNRVSEVKSDFDSRKFTIQQNLKQLLKETYPGIMVQVIFQ